MDGETQTDPDGHYAIFTSTTETSIQIFAFYDDPDTEGYDHLPAKKGLIASEGLNASVDFTLEAAATVNIIGQLKPMEMTSKVNRYALEVVDPSSD